MDAVKFLKEKYRMTKQCNIFCKECPLGHPNNGLNVDCTLLEAGYTVKAVEIVKKWSDEHPQKTYLQDFVEKFPNCVKDEEGLPASCRKFIYPLMSRKNCSGWSCSDCWNEPMEDKQ